MKAKSILVALLVVLAGPKGPAVQQISGQQRGASATRAAVEYLASDQLEGREAGSPGERLAGDYIAMQLARAGAKPLPGHSDMFMPFEFTAGTRDGGTTISISRNSGAPQTFTGASD